MKLLVDAQLPRRLVEWLREAGCDAIHTRDLPSANRTKDHEIIRLADLEARIVVTKDEDFVDSHLLRKPPGSFSSRPATSAIAIWTSSCVR